MRRRVIGTAGTGRPAASKARVNAKIGLAGNQHVRPLNAAGERLGKPGPGRGPTGPDAFPVAQGEGPARGRGLFRADGLGRPRRPIRAQGRQGVRLRQKRDAEPLQGRGHAEGLVPQPRRQAARAGARQPCRAAGAAPAHATWSIAAGHSVLALHVSLAACAPPARVPHEPGHRRPVARTCRAAE